MCLVKHLKVYLVPSKCDVFAVIIRESFQEEVIHKGRTVFQVRNWQKMLEAERVPQAKAPQALEVHQRVQDAIL